MKKIFLILTMIILLAGIPLVVFYSKQKQELRQKAAPATSLEIKPASESAKINDVFTKTIAIDTGENVVSAAKLEITFDKTKLKATKIEAGDFITEILEAGVITEDKATIMLGSGGGLAKKGSGMLAKVTFQALASGENTRITLSPATKVAGAEEATDVLTTKGVYGTVTITSDSVQPTVTLTPTPEGGETPTEAPTLAPTVTNTPLPTATPTEDTGGSSDSSSGDGSSDSSSGGDSNGTVDNRLSDSGTGGTNDSGPLGNIGGSEGAGTGRTYEFVLTNPPKGSVVRTQKPLIKGKAKPGSTITYTIYSDPITGVVTVDANGNFEITPDSPLADASHNITLTEESSDGTSRTLASNFVVQTKAPPVSGNIKPIFIIGGIAIGLILLGFGIPLIP